jgi:hypothetical protein
MGQKVQARPAAVALELVGQRVLLELEQVLERWLKAPKWGAEHLKRAA